VSLHPSWIVPDWPAPPRVRAFVTTREGGVSEGEYSSMNLGTSSGDLPDHVTRNRAIVRTALPGDPAWLAQVHGIEVADLDALPEGERAARSLGVPGEETIAWLGPAIGPDAFEVGPEVRDAFMQVETQAHAAFRAHKPGKFMGDLYRLARMRLARAGVKHVYGGGFCTWSETGRFFSYRREQRSGRMGAFIWIMPE